MTYEVILSPVARRALSEELPEVAAAACFEFMTGGFRVIYDIDDDRIRVEVISIRHRRDVYRV